MNNYIMVCISSQARRESLVAFVMLAVSAFGTELTHRWSFNGVWSDSVGGTDAVKCGS